MVRNQKKIGSLMGFLRTALQAVISVAYIPLLLNGIGDSEYGIYQIVGSCLAYFTVMEAPLSAAVLKYYSQSLADGDRVGMENTLALGRRIFRLLSLCFLILCGACIPLIRWVYASKLSPAELDEACVMFVLMVVNLIVGMNNCIYSSSINAHEHYVFIQGINLVSLCLQPLAVVACIRQYPYAASIVVVHLVLSTVLALTQRIYARRRLKVRVKLHHRDNALLKGIFLLATNVLVVALADQIFWKVDQLIIGAMIGPEAVAVYSVGSQFNTMYISLGCVLGSMMLPAVTRLYRGVDREEAVSAFFARIGRYQSFILGLVLSGVILFGREFILILSGPGYDDAYYVALLLMIPYTVDLTQLSANSILQVKNLYHIRSFVLVGMAFANVVLTLLFTKSFGILGAAAATTVTILIGYLAILNPIYRYKAKIDLKRFWKSVLPIFGGIALCTLLGFPIRYLRLENPLLQFFVHGVLYVPIYGGVMFFVFMKPAERQMLLGKLMRRKVSAGNLNKPNKK